MILSILMGGITHHYIGSHLPYCNTINNYGTISHSYTAVMVGNSKAKAGVLIGKDSACGPIFGGLSSFALTEYTEFVLGGYNTNFKQFRQRGIEPPTLFNITPVIGIDFKLPVIQTEEFKVSVDNLVSLGIITHSVNFTFKL